MKKHTNLHHCIPQSRYRIDDNRNVIRINKKKHDAFHQIFENDMPHETIGTVLLFNEKVVQIDAIDDIINFTNEYVYKELFYKKDLF